MGPKKTQETTYEPRDKEPDGWRTHCKIRKNRKAKMVPLHPKKEIGCPKKKYLNGEQFDKSIEKMNIMNWRRKVKDKKKWKKN